MKVSVYVEYAQITAFAVAIVLLIGFMWANF